MATAKPTEPEVDEDEAATAAEDKGQSGQASRDMNAMDKPEEAAKEEKFDADKLRQAVADMTNTIQTEKEARKQKEEALQKIAVKDTDVALVMAELEVTKAVAERKLRLHNNNLEALLKETVNLK